MKLQRDKSMAGEGENFLVEDMINYCKDKAYQLEKMLITKVKTTY